MTDNPSFTIDFGGDVDQLARIWPDYHNQSVDICRYIWTQVQGLPQAKNIEISVQLLGNEDMAELNGQYRHTPKPTNVLSFPSYASLNELPEDNMLLVLGDVVFALDVVRDEATQQEKDVRDHITHLWVHAILHLLGYDHQDEQEAERMEKLECSILRQFGVANPYET